jgi:hypothetical protein
LAEAHLAAAAPEDGHSRAERAVAEARAYGQRGDEATALHLLGITLLETASSDLDRVAAHLYEALSVAEELGMRPLVAHCHLGLGKLYRRTGKREQAQEHLTTATTMYREMGMKYWLEQAEAELRVR